MTLLDLFRPRWRHPDPGIRKAAVEKLTKQSALATVARNDEKPEVRAAAVDKLTDQSVLGEIARADSIPAIREAAALKLTSQAAFAVVATSGVDAELREFATWRLRDQRTLASVACTDEAFQVRETAVWQLTNRTVLAEILERETDSKVNTAARSRLDELDAPSLAQIKSLPRVRVSVFGFHSERTLRHAANFIRRQSSVRVSLRKEKRYGDLYLACFTGFSGSTYNRMWELINAFGDSEAWYTEKMDYDIKQMEQDSFELS